MKVFDEEFIKIATEIIRESMEETKSVIPFEKIDGYAKDIDSYTEDEKIKLIKTIKSNEVIVYSYRYSHVLTFFNAFTLFKLLGYEVQANMLIGMMIKYFSMEDITRKLVVASNRHEKSKAKKGKTNRHHDSALKIAMDTWGEYPNASLAGMTEEIHAHLRSKWNDTPTAETIKSWLKKSNLYPDAKPKNRDFKLVINDEG